jgi:uncharacterized protein
MNTEGLVYGSAVFGFFALLLLFRRLVHKEGPRSFLIHADRRGAALVAGGAGIGIGLISAYAAAASIVGLGKLEIRSDTLRDTVGTLAISAYVFAAIALFEECLYRGYILRKLKARLPLSASVILTSGAFGAQHFLAYSSSAFFWIGLFNAFLFGIALSLVALKTGSIMAPIGIHFAWNTAGGVLFSETGMGTASFANMRIDEGIWAGSPGNPESGLIVTIVFALALAATLALVKREPRDNASLT